MITQTISARRYSYRAANLLPAPDPNNGSGSLGNASATDCLTALQLEIFRLVAMGASAKETAKLLKLSVKGVNSLTYRIMKKLDVHNRVGLARLAIREGLVSP